MRDISLKELLEAGCHFGHQVTRQNPRAREFVYQAREGIHIIDLAKTKEGLQEGAKFVKEVASRGGNILFVGTKRQARGILSAAIKRISEAPSSGVYFVTERWVGGTLTNFDEVGKNYRKLKDLRSRLQSSEEKAKYTKKEVGMWEKERQKLEKFYAGVCELAALPDVMFVIDTHKEEQAVNEAVRTGVAVVGIVDTNADPSLVDYSIPANDDAVGSIALITEYITDAWIEGRKQEVSNVSEVSKGKNKQAEKVEKVEQVEKPKRVATTKAKTKTVENKKEVGDGKRKPRTTKKTS